MYDHHHHLLHAYGLRVQRKILHHSGKGAQNAHFHAPLDPLVPDPGFDSLEDDAGDAARAGGDDGVHRDERDDGTLTRLQRAIRPKPKLVRGQRRINQSSDSWQH